MLIFTLDLTFVWCMVMVYFYSHACGCHISQYCLLKRMSFSYLGSFWFHTNLGSLWFIQILIFFCFCKEDRHFECIEFIDNFRWYGHFNNINSFTTWVPNIFLLTSLITFISIMYFSLYSSYKKNSFFKFFFW